jgi:hypothetical protein
MDQQVIDFKQKLVDENKSGLVLDVDETLSWTIGYWVEQLQQKFGNPENLLVQEIIDKYRYAQLVPYWQTPTALEWMENAREDNQIQEPLSLIDNANYFVDKINSIIPIVGYLTTRPRTVLPGTKKWLAKYNFPKVEVLARPAEISSPEGDSWKAVVLNFLYPEVKGIIDDKSFIAGSLPPNYKGTFFLFNSDATKQKDTNVIPCKTWSDVYAQVKLVYGAK